MLETVNSKEKSFNKTKEIFQNAKENKDYEIMLKIGRLFESLLSQGNTDLSLKLFDDIHYKLLFEALEYLPYNFDLDSGEKQQSYFNFLENEACMRSIDRNIISENFEKIVKLRFRINFFIEFVLDPKTPDPLTGHYQIVAAS